MVFRKQSASAKQGSIIVLVLVLVVLLTFVVVAFLEEATARIKYYGLFHNRDDLRTDAYSVLEITLAVINEYREIEGALWGPSQGWGNPLREIDFVPAHAGSVSVRFEDESAKLPLSSMEYNDLLVFFDVLGFDLPEAQSLADGLIDWTDEDDLRRLNGFDGEDYEDMDPPYRAANSPIITWDEFRLIEPFRTLFWDDEGRPTDRWPTFKSAVSLYHTGAVNINQANSTVLAYLSEKGLLDERAFLFYKNGSDGEIGTEDDRLYRQGEGSTFSPVLPAEGANVSDRIELLRITVEAARGEARFVLEVLVSWAGANPGAGDAASRETAQPDTEPVVETNPRSARAQRQRARGETRTAPSAAASLGYPFRFLRITENRKF
ncbi:MAG: general secretion pathway protein GspK [Oceanipulchritudo sp.]